MPGGGVTTKRRCMLQSATWAWWRMSRTACWCVCRATCCGRCTKGFFAVIFWYFVLGPGAALAYRLVALCGEHSQQPALKARAEQLRHIMDWLPVRLMAMSFALVGNFLAVTRVMLHEVLNWHISAAHLVARVGRIADDIPEEEDSQRGLGRLDSFGSCCCAVQCCGMPGLRCGPCWSDLGSPCYWRRLADRAPPGRRSICQATPIARRP